MRLSDVKGERVFDVVADLIEPVTAIAQDPEMKALLDVRNVPEGVGVKDHAFACVRKHAPKLIKAHKKDVIAILAAIEGTTPKKYAAGITMASLLKDVFELATDEDFLDFLASNIETNPTSQPSASESTQDREE